jgi:hypothetical protein
MDLMTELEAGKLSFKIADLGIAKLFSVNDQRE